MQQIATNDPLNASCITGCTLCKYYWLARLGTAQGGSESVHASRFAALAHADATRARGMHFVLVEMPALFFPCERQQLQIGSEAGLLLTEGRVLAPMAVHGAVSLSSLGVRSVLAQFARAPEQLRAFKTGADMPALVLPLQAWRSRSVGIRRPLKWECVNRRVAFDLSHLESLRMRFDQQIRQLSAGNSLCM
jgi:hypothetical protein